MGLFSNEIAIFDEIENNIYNVIKDTIKRFDFVLIDFNTNKQLNRKGVDSKSKPLLPKYADSYVRIRVKKGLQTDHVDLNFTGAFQKSITITVENDQFIIESDVHYDKYLVKKYGKNILGIEQQYLNEFAENYLYPQLKKSIDDQLAKS